MIRNYHNKTSQQFETVFFDLDGTITDSADGILNALRYMFDKLDFHNYENANLKRFIGPPIQSILMDEYGFTEDAANKALPFFREYYNEYGIFENRLYEGITKSIQKIADSGKAVYIATSKSEEQAHRVIEHFQLQNLFRGVFGANQQAGIRLKREVLAYALQNLGHVQNAVMVGDRVYDVEGGRSIQAATVGVLYGYGGLTELETAGCDYVVDTPEDLSQLLG